MDRRSRLIGDISGYAADRILVMYLGSTTASALSLLVDGEAPGHENGVRQRQGSWFALHDPGVRGKAPTIHAFCLYGVSRKTKDHHESRFRVG